MKYAGHAAAVGAAGTVGRFRGFASLHIIAALWCCGALAAPAQAQGAAGLLGARPVERRFQDWLLVCDNTRVCRAQATGYGGSLMVRRDPGPNGAILVVLDGQEPSSGPSLPDLASIRVAGGLAPGGWRLDRASESAKLEGRQALTFLWAIAPARSP